MELEGAPVGIGALAEATEPVGQRGQHQAANTLLRGRWLVIARAAWVALASLALGFYLFNSPVRFEQLRTVCTESWCGGRLGPEGVATLRQLGLSLDLYAAYTVILYLAFTLVCWTVAAVIIWRKSDDWLALFIALMLWTLGAVWGFHEGMLRPAWSLVHILFMSLDLASIIVLFYLFPDGHFVPRWTRAGAVLWLASLLLLATVLALDSLFGYEPPELFWQVGVLLFIGACGTGGFAQLYRYRHVSTPVQRQQTKWVVFGLLAVAAWFVGTPLYLNFVRPA
ncbi:MAG: hypothetical protein M3220_13700, partial [Chloroflexota bacterium]|nr:hypothetical protein [Chloroflexota bacterium]